MWKKPKDKPEDGEYVHFQSVADGVYYDGWYNIGADNVYVDDVGQIEWADVRIWCHHESRQHKQPPAIGSKVLFMRDGDSVGHGQVKIIIDDGYSTIDLDDVEKWVYADEVFNDVNNG